MTRKRTECFLKRCLATLSFAVFMMVDVSPQQTNRFSYYPEISGAFAQGSNSVCHSGDRAALRTTRLTTDRVNGFSAGWTPFFVENIAPQHCDGTWSAADGGGQVVAVLE